MLTAIFSLIGTAFVGAFAWIFQDVSRLDSRVSVLETRDADLKILINSRFDEVNRRLSRIENNTVNGNGKVAH